MIFFLKIKLFLLLILLFFIASIGIFINRKNLILILICLELLILILNLLFAFFSIYLNDIIGNVFFIYLLIIAASESSLGLAILVAYNELNLNIEISNINKLFG